MIIKNGICYSAVKGFAKRNIYVDDKFISKVCEGENGLVDEAVNASCQIIDAENMYVLPGFVDIHTHGAVGSDASDGESEGLKKIAAYELISGVTTFCPTSMSLSISTLTKVFQTIAALQKQHEQTFDLAEIGGINMEGPFINKAKKGAQNAEYIVPANFETFTALMQASNGLIKIIDLAPEVPGTLPFIKQLRSEYPNLRISLAHTTASYAEAMQGFLAGANHVTHLYNAMPLFKHREPGVIGAAFDAVNAVEKRQELPEKNDLVLRNNIGIELIADGVHSEPASVRLAFHLFSDRNIILISDTMRACGLSDGTYTLGGQKVTVHGNKAALDDGTIAGSATNLYNCFRTAVKKMHIPLISAVRAASTNPAAALGLTSRIGDLAGGMQADILICDRDLDLKYIIKKGKIISGVTL